MPDLTGFPALDVAIGLAFLFFLLSTAASAINEAIAALLGWRAKTLEDGIARMLGDEPRGVWKRLVDRFSKGRKGLAERGLAASVFEHWAVTALVRDPNSRFRRRRQPSYLPPDVVSLAVSEAAHAERHAPRARSEAGRARRTVSQRRARPLRQRRTALPAVRRREQLSQRRTRSRRWTSTGAGRKSRTGSTTRWRARGLVQAQGADDSTAAIAPERNAISLARSCDDGEERGSCE